MKNALLALLCFCFAGLAVADVPKKPSAFTPVGSGSGLVWKIEGGKAPVYLVGSFHLLRKKDQPLPEPLHRAYADSEQVWCEIAPGEMEKPENAMKMMAAGALPPDKSLSDVISAETYELVRGWEGDPTMKIAFQRMQPWVVAMTIMLLEYQKLGIDPQYGIEKTFEALAKKDAKGTGGFETVEQQMGLFTGLTPKQQDEMLAQTFEELAEAKKTITDMIASWRKGDDTAVAKQMNESFDKYPDMKKALLDDRNAAWIPQIEKLMESGKKTMVIVGAGHLCGEGSVVDLLQKKGVKLTRLTAEEAPATPPKVD